MNPEAETIFGILASAAAGAREQYWREHPTTPEVRAEVESLLRFDPGSSTALGAEFAAAASDVFAPGEDWSGLRCGPYRLTEVAGRGGMGVVYRAEREDGELSQSVAIKLLPSGLPDPGARAVFLRERQILAGLAHSNIARLLDAGHLGDGRPYLVMEYVDGKPIDEHCQQLSVRDKLLLFRSVCGAVAHAHANLVVHRDLKPSNILVTRQGEVKLLDFGIARILDMSNTGVTQEIRLTPDFASPEQIRGEQVSTATDVYSLGAVLYLLLTGQKPHQFTSRSAGAIEAAICRAEPIRPSHHVPELRGDLETILLEALRKEPGERYASADKLSADVSAYLESRPIEARMDEFGYAARKFLRRAWIPLTAAALAVAGLFAGLAIARRERSVAQDRFNQVRGLAGQLFEIDRDISNLPGSSRARERIVRTALGYLDGLGGNVAAEPILANDVARGYLQVGRVQGVPNSVNLGNLAGAVKTLAAAERVIKPHLEPAALSVFADPGLLLLTGAEIAHDRMILANEQANEADVIARGAETLARVEALEATHPKSYRGVSILLADASQIYSGFFRMELALRLARHSVVAARRGKDPVRDPIVLSIALANLASVLRKNGDLEAALETIREVRPLLPRGAGGPGGWYPQFNVEMIEGEILGGEETVSLNRPSESALRLQAAADLAAAAVQRDGQDFTSCSRLCSAANELGRIVSVSDPARALHAHDSCILAMKAFAANPKGQRQRSEALAESADALRRLNRASEAQQRIDEAAAIVESTGRETAGSFPPMGEMHLVLTARARHFGQTGRRQEAIGAYSRILAFLDASGSFRPALDPRHANELSRTLTSLAALHREAGEGPKAAQLEARRLELWRAHHRRLPGNPFVRRRLAAAEKP